MAELARQCLPRGISVVIRVCNSEVTIAPLTRIHFRTMDRPTYSVSPTVDGRDAPASSELADSNFRKAFLPQ